MIPIAAEEAAAAIRRWFDAAVSAVNPANAVQSHLRRCDLVLQVDDRTIPITGRLFVAAIGKAALGMSRGASAVCGDLIERGLIITKDGHLDSPLPERFEAYEASHPIPDRRGIEATERLLSRVSDYGEGDVVLALISGGGSALMEAPIAGVSLTDVATTTDLLLRAGAPIQDLNAVRIPLSRVKGGGLRRSAPNAHFVTLLLSDVLGNDLRVIASGPTVPTDFTREGAIDVLVRYQVIDRVPIGVRAALSAESESVDDVIFGNDATAVVGDNASALEAFTKAAGQNGRTARIVRKEQQGEARALAKRWVELLRSCDSQLDLLLGGGEATVTVCGNGEGGRNTEFALAAGIELEQRGLTGWMVASLATDGQDALTGVAGAIVTAKTIKDARGFGIDPERALVNNDSLAVFRAAGGVIESGPTGTNVNDIYVALRIASSE